MMLTLTIIGSNVDPHRVWRWLRHRAVYLVAFNLATPPNYLLDSVVENNANGERP